MSTEDSGAARNRLVDAAIAHLSPELDDRRDVVSDFGRAYFRRVPADELAQQPPEQLAAHLASVFSFVDARRGTERLVRAFNPEEGTHGYSSTGGVVEVVAPDMPFLVDSVTNQIQALGFTSVRTIHPVVGTVRGDDGQLAAVVPARSAPARESVQHHLLDRYLTAEDVATLEKGLGRTLLDVSRATADFESMQGAVYRMMQVARSGSARYGKEEIDEAVAFLEWLLEDNFVFLGYREYRISDEDGLRMLSVTPGSGLGVLRADDDSAFASPVPVAELRPDLRARYEEGDLLVITKTNASSRVHRRAKNDYVGVRHIGPDGSVVGEARMIGLFTSKAYMTPATTIPVLHRKLEQIIEAEDVIHGSHTYKEIVQLFDSFPKDELFATNTADIRASIAGLIELQERQRVRLFVRRDLLQRNVSVLVVMPRDRFNASLRRRLQDYLLERFGGKSIDYRLALGETDTARLHFTIWADGEVPEVSIRDLEDDVVALAQTWEERLDEVLRDRFGPDLGAALREEWAGRFPQYYRSSVPLEIVAGDIAKLDQLVQAADGRAVVGLQTDGSDGESLTRLAVYRADGKLELSTIMPVLEALGLRVVEEVPTRILGGDGQMYIHDFGVTTPDGDALPLETEDRIAGTIAAVLEGSGESDSLNRLIVSSRLDHEQIGLLRAYRTYWQRVSPGFTVEYINDAFAAHPAIAADLVALFEARFGPEADPKREADLVAAVVKALDGVKSLDEDRILRGFLGLIGATLRTNAYRPGVGCLAFKFRSADVPAMPLPSPLYEIFVYASEVEGIHLRGGPVARGGIRWSTRKEDYRTEVLGLMKAQMTKNAVIVPTGSKGGFVLRTPPVDPGELREAVREGYITFIRGLLDVTDNLVEGEVVHPIGVTVHDGPDPYLVVAADKGTATFSDTANEIASAYDFWLEDAFASGGSAGYDHKALGITARGAWESVKWHFQELGIDVMSEPFTVVGIGDMSGDVFGNGMLLSPHIRLVAAFDHRHVFLDPDPDPATSFAERQRLFGLARSSWEDYDPALISPGGGVFARSDKRIELSPQVRELLGITETALTPDEVIKAILSAPVDLLWNGGIGTYVKATGESDDSVGDRANDALRVNGRGLRCRVVGEGGNLGMTQAGRIEFALAGGRVNTDFIDNAGGVHCSDREVNLKILLGLAERSGELDRAGRDALITEVVDDVVRAILYENFLQAQILAQEVEVSRHRLEAYEDLMVLLETEGLLNRAIEVLPTTDDMNERARTGAGMTSPELSVLLAYAKRSLRDWLLASDLPDWQDVAYLLTRYFPERVVERFGHLVGDHPLRREIIATVVANRVVDSEGVTFVTRLMAETGAAPDQVVRAYQIARNVVDAKGRWAGIEDLVGKVPLDVGRELMRGVDALVESIARWYLTNPTEERMSAIIERSAAAVGQLAEELPNIGPVEWVENCEADAAAWVELGVPEQVARRHVYQEELVHAPDMVAVAERTGRSVRDVAELFLLVGPAFQIDWLETQSRKLPASNRWHRRANQTVRDDLVLLRRQLAERILEEAPDSDPAAALDRYLAARTAALGRLTRFMRSLAVDGVDDVASVIVAIRQIRALTV